jgi:hypothetical protein
MSQKMTKTPPTNAPITNILFTGVSAVPVVDELLVESDGATAARIIIKARAAKANPNCGRD